MISALEALRDALYKYTTTTTTYILSPYTSSKQTFYDLHCISYSYLLIYEKQNMYAIVLALIMEL